MYREQRDLLEEQFDADAGNPDCDAATDGVRTTTVDSFQGQEAPIVIIDLVSSDPERPAEVGFIAHPKRLNVATTRAQQYSFIVGNWSLWMKDPRGLAAARRSPRHRLWNQRTASFHSFLKWVEENGQIVHWPQDKLKQSLDQYPAPDNTLKGGGIPFSYEKKRRGSLGGRVSVPEKRPRWTENSQPGRQLDTGPWRRGRVRFRD